MIKGEKISEETRLKMVSACKKRRSYTGENNPNWRGGKTIMKDGRTLLYAPDHPDANAIGGLYILEYRLVAEKKTGRRLLKNEIVHHVNGDATDNHASNLEVMSQAKHCRIHFAKLTEKQVMVIRKDSRTHRILSKEYNISKSQIGAIKRGEYWKPLKEGAHGVRL